MAASRLAPLSIFPDLRPVERCFPLYGVFIRLGCDLPVWGGIWRVAGGIVDLRLPYRHFMRAWRLIRAGVFLPDLKTSPKRRASSPMETRRFFYVRRRGRSSGLQALARLACVMAGGFKRGGMPVAPCLKLPLLFARSPPVKLWKLDAFLIATWSSPKKQLGYVYNGLGLYIETAPTHTKPAKWSLTHLGTGHRVYDMVGSDADVLPVATLIADAGDWTFEGLDGWKNAFPDARERFLEIRAAHPHVFPKAKKNGHGSRNEEVARAIAMSRS